MITVLYVDADPKMWKIISIIFEKYGDVSIYPAGSGEEALAGLSLYHADVIISYYDLPKMNGIELLHRVRAGFGDIPFILFTDDDTREVCTEAHNGGADFCVKKSHKPQNRSAARERMFRQAIELKWTRDRPGELKEQERQSRELSDNAHGGYVLFRNMPDGHLGRFPESGTYFYVKKNPVP